MIWFVGGLPCLAPLAFSWLIEAYVTSSLGCRERESEMGGHLLVSCPSNNLVNFYTAFLQLAHFEMCLDAVGSCGVCFTAEASC